MFASKYVGQHRVGRLLDRLGQRFRQHDVFRRAVLATIERHRAQEGVRRLQPVGNRLDDLLADRHLAAILKIVLRPHADLAQHIFELLAVELPVRTLEGGVRHGELRQLVLRKAEAELACLLVEHGAGNELRQNLFVDAERLGLLARQPRAELLRHHRDLPVVGEAVFDRRNRGAAGGDDRIAAEAGDQRAGDAPDGKAHDEEDQQQFRHPGSGSTSQGRKHE